MYTVGTYNQLVSVTQQVRMTGTQLFDLSERQCNDHCPYTEGVQAVSQYRQPQ